jgi:hypothetical protein
MFNKFKQMPNTVQPVRTDFVAMSPERFVNFVVAGTWRASLVRKTVIV